MSSIEEKVTIHTCDAPECSTQAVVREVDDLPSGFFGTTSFTHAGGGGVADWFACTALHIRKAVVAVQLAGFSTNPALPKVRVGTPADDVEDTGTTRN